MIDIDTIIDALAAADSGLKTVKSGAGTIEAIKQLLRNKKDGAEVDIEELKQLISDLRDENVEYREALWDARNKLLELKREVEEADAAVEMRARYHLKKFKAGGTVLVCNKEERIDIIPEYVCPNCYLTDALFMPLQPGGYAGYQLACNKCGLCVNWDNPESSM
ncbi:hypothetical protein KX928_12665 [Roseobacter sp. YSTF-M11]|uniref:Uncharacterized protein n=1 Tax=Roseobacter insulae TaxID=2859783 RepID=A0A9X1FVZ9_9RHOB|nr:hypothetical protein [Roseobacter insulae]MBW4708637.1 hypothetical protein [Roseobacter insulae]